MQACVYAVQGNARNEDCEKQIRTRGLLLMRINFRFRTILYVITIFIILFASSMVLYALNAETYLGSLVDISYFDLLLGQIANTLIVLSLTSVLSTDFGHAYWIDIKETKLVSPIWGCFIGITTYLLTGLVYSFFSYIIGFEIGVAVSYTISTILLIFLTFKMIGIYFGKEALKKGLRVEYRKLLILNSSSYVSDYARRLENFCSSLIEENFTKKRIVIWKIKKEVDEIKRKLDSGNNGRVDKCHKQHLEKYFEGIDRLREIDSKLEEYTKNAIDNNDTEVVRENIELLVETENYDTFFNIIEDLFEWDEKYTCRILKELSEKNRVWVIKDRLKFFKQYALERLISDSGKLDALQNLLLIYDPSNLGMKEIKNEIKCINEKAIELMRREAILDSELAKAEDILECVRIQKEARNVIKKEDEDLSARVRDILRNLKTQELRSFYIPLEEACIAYDEGKYSVVNKYLSVILINFRQDRFMIKSGIEINNIKSDMQFTFSYLTENEKIKLNALFEKDKQKMRISEELHSGLLELYEVTISNNTMEDINTETLEIFRSSLDLPKIDTNSLEE